MGSNKIKPIVKVIWAVAALTCFVTGLLNGNNTMFAISIAAGCFCLLVVAIYYGEMEEYDYDQLESADEFIRREHAKGNH